MKFSQAWKRASNPRPIVIIGAGAIVRTAHIPAYRKLEYPIAGLYDIRFSAAFDTASAFGIRSTLGLVTPGRRCPSRVTSCWSEPR